jgi:lipopolysaccharide/colanic/teichoic acid biosynthesis glycosyltransferase
LTRAASVVDGEVGRDLSSAHDGVAARRLGVPPVVEHLTARLTPIRQSRWRELVKRAVDIGVALVLLAVTAPVMAMAMVAVSIDSGRPIFFRQIRAGRGGRAFAMWKLRTMVPDAERRLVEVVERNEADGPLFKLRQDPRVTRVGRVLRRLSIDELPQLWNVLRGEMSMVGPRPALFSEVHAWTPEVRSRLQVRPGITGLWQVSGRSNSTFAHYVRCDQEYVESWTLWGDIVILARTVKVVITGHGAT